MLPGSVSLLHPQLLFLVSCPKKPKGMGNGEWYVVSLETLLIFSQNAPAKDVAKESVYQENEMCFFTSI